ncbi:eukaryotic translation initiation factor 4 gamma-like [Lathyrus oleraceus]|uniref:eukaryotic translation initiation factor 4 gamma-like n=1 Tax=Pisum sativum TaxID=3888 RepID=UPI0021D1F1C3|nr:eukaryotic translation initiation factor 4 gamma-like [Pisum sativum]
MKRQREPYKKTKKAKREKLGETFVSIPPVPLVSSSSPSKSLPSNSPSLHLRQMSSSLPEPSSIYTYYEPTPSTTNPYETPTSNPPSHPLQKFNLTTTTLPISEAQLFNEPISPPSLTPSSPPYYTISSDSEPSELQSPTITQLQARALSAHNQPEPETNIPSPSEQPPTSPYEPHIETPTENPITHQSEPPTETIPTPPTPTSPTSEPEPTFAALEEAVTLFGESLVEKIKSLSENSRISDDPSVVRIHWNRDRLTREAEERARREAEEKACLEENQREREVAEKAATEAATAAAEAEAKAKANAEEVARIATKEAAKTREDALTQREQSHFDFAPLVLKTLEELQKEQEIVTARLDQ